ncbi:MAG: hypothetical protein RL124_906 [Acidobacteriota bacterium]|jgi:Na+/H+-dicarboxylate symporter
MKPKSAPLTKRIFIGMGSGVITGITLGEHTQTLKALGDIYIGLMQMTVLPYIVFSLIGNIGRLSTLEFKSLAKNSISIFALLWAVSSVTVLLVSLSLPESSTGRFFSSAMMAPAVQTNLLELFIPSNPFRALSENSVPAVVLFCLLFGIAIIGFDEKQSLLSHVDLITKALHRVNGFIVKLTPVGVFGITAFSVGTMSLEELERLQVYYILFALCAGLLVFAILPLIATSLTPFSYLRIITASKDALLTSFVTGSVFPVIPILIDGVQDLFKDHFRKDPAHKDFPEFILPLAYPFPNSGNVIDLIFIFFSGWFIGNSLSITEKVETILVSFFLLFGKVYLTIPFLLNMHRIPEDMFQLFLAAGVLAARIGDCVSSMHFLVFAILTTSAMTGLLRLNKKKLLFSISLIALVIFSLTSLASALLFFVSHNNTSTTSKISQMEVISNTVQYEILSEVSTNPSEISNYKNRLDRIRSRGKIRIGFLPDNLPYSFRNSNGNLVGFDIDLSYKLAHDLGVGIEFVPYSSSNLQEKINSDCFDIAVSGLTDSLQRSTRMLMTDPYLKVSLGFVIKDHERSKFLTERNIKLASHLRIAVEKGSYFESRVAAHFPDAEIVPLENIRDFFEDDWRNIDALATHAESGAAWTLVYPAYSVINPLNRSENAPISIAVSGFDVVLDDTLNTWIRLQQMEGFIDLIYDHWFLGKESQNATTLPMLFRSFLASLSSSR